MAWNESYTLLYLKVWGEDITSRPPPRRRGYPLPPAPGITIFFYPHHPLCPYPSCPRLPLASSPSIRPLPPLWKGFCAITSYKLYYVNMRTESYQVLTWWMGLDWELCQHRTGHLGLAVERLPHLYAAQLSAWVCRPIPGRARSAPYHIAALPLTL